MQRFRWIALQGNSRGMLPPLLLFCFITTSGIPAHAADDPAACRIPVARVVSIQGSIEVLRAPQNDWIKVTRLDIPLCEGDRLRTGVLSRAALFIQPETLVRVDQNTNISLSQTAEETLIEFRQEDVLPAAASAYSCGAGYFITRFPRKFRVKTPHLNAAVEGTEFLVAMRCESTELSVFEGKVLAAGAGANIFPAQSISSGQVLTIGGTEPPTVKVLIKPADAVQWVVYYPPLSDATAEADLPPAEQCRSLPKPLDQTCLTQRAEALLRIGRVDEAQREVDEAVALDPGSGDANALRAIISIARNEKAGALEAATAATTASPNSSRAWLALSYAQQASFKLDDSLVSARKAQALEPNSSVTNARVAELLMSLGRIKEAERAARAAVDANPFESRAHTVLGFVHLAQIKTKAARADFFDAIERDSSDPLPRLGLGLAIIRDGKLVEGREQLEIAVALDPTNSLLRSYVGKAYYEENSKERDKLASTQFGLAKPLDPNDPTPWFYDAILKQTRNRPVEALEDLQQSIGLNDNRAVYRSQLLLDQDLATRSNNLAQTYQDIGLDQLATVEAAKSVTTDPTNYSAHRFIADSYQKVPRGELARASEYLQAQLRAPIALYPVSPFRGLALPFSSPRNLIASPVSPTRTAFSDYTPLFESTGARGYFESLAGTQNTLGEQLVVAGAWDHVAVSAGQAQFHTDGFEADQRYRQESYNGVIQVQASDRVSFQGEVLAARSQRDEIQFPFDPANRFLLKIGEYSKSSRIGGRYDDGKGSSLIITAATQELNQDFYDPEFDDRSTADGSATTEEIQYSYQGRVGGVIAGFGHLDGSQSLSGNLFPSETAYDNGYLYGRLSNRSRIVDLQLGIGVVTLKNLGLRLTETCPKFGLILTPLPGTTLRLSNFKTVRRQLLSNQTIEPTQIGGFNQFWDDPNASVVWQQGLGIDHRLSHNLYAGAEVYDRQIDVPLFFPGGASFFRWQETIARAYAAWLIPKREDRAILSGWSFALSLDYWSEDLQRPQVPIQGLLSLTTHVVPLRIIAFPGFGWSAEIDTTYTSQHGLLQAPGANTFDVSNDYWITSFALTYKLPRRVGSLSLGISNVFNRQFEYVAADPADLRVAPERLIFARFTAAF